MSTETESTYFRPGPDDDHRVPGEVVVKLAADLDRAVGKSIPSAPLRAHDAGVDRFGVSALDSVLGKLGASAVVRVHGPLPETVFAKDVTASVAADLTTTYRVRFGAEVTVDDAAGELAGLDDVVEAAPNYYRWVQAVPNDPMFGLQWGLTKINAPAAWDRTLGSSAVIVAVIDTGVDLDHPDLAPNLVPGQDLVDLVGVSPPAGTRFEGDFLGRDPVPEDEVGHGTHVAGTIAALTNNFVGVAGVAGRCRILPVRVLARVVRIADGRVSGSGTAVDIATGIRWAVDHGARILNLSLGGYGDTFVERDAVAYAVARGAVVVAAMGNDNTSQPSYPAAYPAVVAVGATDDLDHRAAFSNTGAHIDVAAPGVGIRSTDWDNTYSNKSGTSMATPHVAGVAALVRSVNSGLDAAHVAQIVRDTARPLRDDPSDPIPNDRYGSGLVDARAAVDRASPASPCRPCIPPPPCVPPPPCRPCIPPPPCVPPPPCRPCIPPPPCVPPPPCRPCVPPPACRPCGPCSPGGFGQTGYEGWGHEQYDPWWWWWWFGGEPGDGPQPGSSEAEQLGPEKDEDADASQKPEAPEPGETRDSPIQPSDEQGGYGMTSYGYGQGSEGYDQGYEGYGGQGYEAYGQGSGGYEGYQSGVEGAAIPPPPCVPPPPCRSCLPPPPPPPCRPPPCIPCFPPCRPPCRPPCLPPCLPPCRPPCRPCPPCPCIPPPPPCIAQQGEAGAEGYGQGQGQSQGSGDYGQGYGY